jgi:YfiH family protein
VNLPAGWIVPSWPAPPRVRAFVTTRAGGVSQGEHGSLNLGLHSGDDLQCVAQNRDIVARHLPSAPAWLVQVHGTAVADLDAGDASLRGQASPSPGRETSPASPADAAVTSRPGRVAVVLTADCLPVFLCRADGSRVGVAHAGWRGLAAGVLENAVAEVGGAAGGMLAWLGPAIGPAAFEVGPEVREAFVGVDPEAARAFSPHRGDRLLADLYLLARQRLARAGLTAVYGGGFCTHTERERFFSYRRVRASGRMGAFIWLEDRA